MKEMEARRPPGVVEKELMAANPVLFWALPAATARGEQNLHVSLARVLLIGRWPIILLRLAGTFLS